VDLEKGFVVVRLKWKPLNFVHLNLMTWNYRKGFGVQAMMRRWGLGVWILE
jgi:hypothetical protein